MREREQVLAGKGYSSRARETEARVLGSGIAAEIGLEGTCDRRQQKKEQAEQERCHPQQFQLLSQRV